jgi:hypothetical protein
MFLVDLVNYATVAHPHTRGCARKKEGEKEVEKYSFAAQLAQNELNAKKNEIGYQGIYI